MKLWTIMILMVVSLLFTISCGDDDNDDSSESDDDDDDNDDDDNNDDNDDNDDNNDNDDDPGDAIEPTAGFLARQAEYLTYCNDNNGPGSGGIHGQTCRVAMGETTYNEIKITESCDKINDREDCADFSLNSILRMLHLDKGKGVIPQTIRDQLEYTVLNFKYWLDEPGDDEMCWWSENHQILFHTAELLAGQLYPDTKFPNSQMTGQDHVDHALPLLRTWLDFRGKIGFVEWHSNVYFNEDIPALTNLVDFSEDQDVALRAAMLLDTLGFDFANNFYKGLYATTHGRTYESKLLGGLNDSIPEYVWISLGLGDYNSADNFAATALATSPKYWPPAILEDIAEDAREYNEHKERDSIDIAEGADFGLGYESYEDVMFWWGAGGYAASQVITGTFQMVDDFDLWDGFLWKDIAFMKFLVGSPLLEIVTGAFDEISRGAALEAISTYTFRTPEYQLSGAQDFKPGFWGAQSHIWQATIDSESYVFTSYPGGMPDDYMAGNWTGGWLPRATFYENVGVLQYDRKSIPILDQLLFVSYTHAYFPRYTFDEVVESGNWSFGRKGDSYVGLYSQNPVYWATTSPEDEYELIADGKSNVWIVELGSLDEDGSFGNFYGALQSASITIDGSGVSYESPSIGTVAVGTQGPMTVAGTPVDTGSYERWDNAYAYQEFGTTETVIELDNQRLKLEFDIPKRRYWADTSN